MSDLPGKDVLHQEFLARGFAAGLEKREDWLDAGHVLLAISRDFLASPVPDAEYEKFHDDIAALLNTAHEEAAKMCKAGDKEAALQHIGEIQDALLAEADEFVKNNECLSSRAYFDIQTGYMRAVASIMEMAENREKAKEYLLQGGEMLGEKAAMSSGYEHKLFAAYKANGNMESYYGGFTEIPDGPGDLPVLRPAASPLFDEFEMRQFWKDFARANPKFPYAQRMLELCGSYPVDAISQIISHDLEAINYVKNAEGRRDYAAFDAHQAYPDTISIDTMRKGSQQIFAAQEGDPTGATLEIIEQIAKNAALSCKATLKVVEKNERNAASVRCQKYFEEEGWLDLGKKFEKIILSHFPKGKFVYEPDITEYTLLAEKWLQERFSGGETASFGKFMKREIEKLPSFVEAEDAAFKACVDQLIADLNLNTSERSRECGADIIRFVLDYDEVKIEPFCGDVELETDECTVVFRATEGDINRLLGDYQEPPMIKGHAIVFLAPQSETVHDAAIETGAVKGLHLKKLMPAIGDFAVVSHDGVAPFLGEEETAAMKPGR